MRVAGLGKKDAGQIETDKADIKKIINQRKINWPDLVFGPVNLWTLPSASFFYKKLGRKY